MSKQTNKGNRAADAASLRASKRADTQSNMTPHYFEKFNPTDTWCKHCNCERDEIPFLHIVGKS